MDEPDQPNAPDRAMTWAERVRAAAQALGDERPPVEEPTLDEPPVEDARTEDPAAPGEEAHERTRSFVADEPLLPVESTHLAELPRSDDDATVVAAAPPTTRRKRARHYKRDNMTRVVVEWGAVIVGALAVALLIKTFLFQAFYIPSNSMVDTLDIGDRVLVNKLSYRLHDINRGDVVVFERPPNQPESSIKDLIKRVIALEGETIEVRDGDVYIDGRRLDEPYLEEGVETTDITASIAGCGRPADDVIGCLVPDDHIFVMGDNRVSSADSRVFGPIDEDLVVGRAFAKIWPVTEISGL